MTDERFLLYIHKMLHEDAKHRQEDLKNLQKEQVTSMKQLLDALAIEDGFADFCKNQTASFLAVEPNTCPTAEEIAALKALGITALGFPCIRFADNGKTAKGMWLAETPNGPKALAGVFLPWGDEWKLWKLVLEPSTDDLPAQGYERLYPDPKPMPAPAAPAGGFPGGPGGPGGPAGGPPAGGPAPGGPAPGSAPDGAPAGGAPDGAPAGGPPPMGGPGGPGGEDAAPFDPDARSDVFNMEVDYARLSGDINMLKNMALPAYIKDVEEADALMVKCRRVVTPPYVASRARREL